MVENSWISKKSSIQRKTIQIFEWSVCFSKVYFFLYFSKAYFPKCVFEKCIFKSEFNCQYQVSERGMACPWNRLTHCSVKSQLTRPIKLWTPLNVWSLFWLFGFTLVQALWTNIWKRTLEKSKTNATKSQLALVDRPTQLICISDIYLLLFVNRQI